MTKRQRPPWDEYYLDIAGIVASRSNCMRRQVGALIVVHNSIISTGYNGTPFGVKNCDEGGCPRCASDAPSQAGYDWCLCVHAEQNAMALAARNGSATKAGALYVTLRPCFGCLKEAVQCGISQIVYKQSFTYMDELEGIYQGLVREAGITLRQYPAEGI